MIPPQTDQFTPLVAAAPSAIKQDFQITVIPQAQQAHAFKNGGQAGNTPFFGKNCEPQLSLQRENGRITNIRIQCNCGQTIDLACVYDEKPVRKETPKPEETPKAEKPSPPSAETPRSPSPKRDETPKRRK